MTRNVAYIMSVVIAAALMPIQSAAQAETSFTYQGELTQNGSPADGNYNMQFSLWSQLNGGSLIGSTITQNGVPVNDGRFTVELDFGFSAFDTGDRWLQIRVNTTTLAPRQPINASPFAIKTRGLFVNENESFVGVGRSHQITAAEKFGIYMDTGSFGGMYIETDADGEPFYGYAAGGDVDAFHYFDSASNQWRLWAGADRLAISQTTGFVGIGRTSPITSAEKFGVYMSTSSFGGMYMQTNADGEPFYGYSAGGDADAYHYLNGTTGDWHLVNGGNTRLTVTDTGHVGIGTSTPDASLDVFTSSGLAGEFHGTTTGVAGSTTASTGGNYGVFGQHPFGSSYGVYSSGNFGASGTKAFRIDHPLDPAYKYLLHYCAESPEPLNVYSGTVTLDENGEAWVQLPDYFEYINRDLRYQLTCIGGYANVYIAEEVNDNRFRIAGGTEGLKVSWEVKGVRNDAWVRANGAPTELDKPEHLRGLYQHPELYGLPETLAEHPLLTDRAPSEN